MNKKMEDEFLRNLRGEHIANIRKLNEEIEAKKEGVKNIDIRLKELNQKQSEGKWKMNTSCDTGFIIWLLFHGFIAGIGFVFAMWILFSKRSKQSEKKWKLIRN